LGGDKIKAMTYSKTNSRSVKSQTGQLADRDLLITERLQYIFYNEPKPYSNPNPIK